MTYGLAEKYDAFQDKPRSDLFKQLDQRFPGSKFILIGFDTSQLCCVNIKDLVKSMNGKQACA